MELICFSAVKRYFLPKNSPPLLHATLNRQKSQPPGVYVSRSLIVIIIRINIYNGLKRNNFYVSQCRPNFQIQIPDPEEAG